MADEKHGSYYYPQAAMLLQLRLEDFGDKGSGLSEKKFAISCLAKRISVNRNDYTKADTFEAEIDYKNFPFDPRCIRSCDVMIVMEDMGKTFTDTNSLNPIKPTAENLIFVGFADEESITFDDENRSVKLEGRDLTSLLIDRKYLEGNIALDKPLDQVVRTILGGLEETRSLKIDVRVPGDLPVLASFWSDKNDLSGKKNVKKDQTYWDIIQGIMADAGLIAYIELDRLVISRPRVLYDRNAAKKFVYGKNLKNLEFRRKIGRKKGFNIAVRCLNLDTKEVLEALIPKEATDEWSKATGISNTEVVIPKVAPPAPSALGSKPAEQPSDAEATAKGDPAPYMGFRVANVTSKAQLIEIGQSLYEEIGRQQIEGSFETREMKIKFTRLDKKNEVFNILKLSIGTPIIVEIENDDLRVIRNLRNQAQIESYLVEKRYDRRVARSLAQSIGKSNTPFYTKSITFNMDSESGFDCKVEFLNFIETVGTLKDVK